MVYDWWELLVLKFILSCKHVCKSLNVIYMFINMSRNVLKILVTSKISQRFHRYNVLWHVELKNAEIFRFCQLGIFSFSTRPILGYFSSNHMSPLFLRLSETKILDPNGPYISTLQTNLRNLCLSVISELCVSS